MDWCKGDVGDKSGLTFSVTFEDPVMLDGGGSTQFYFRKVLRGGNPPIIREYHAPADREVPDHVQCTAPTSW